jgi:hypothetical protein
LPLRVGLRGLPTRNHPTALAGLALVCLVATLAAAARYLTAESRAATDARGRAAAEAARVATQIDHILRASMPVVDAVARDLAVRELTLPEIEARLDAALAADARMIAAGAAFERGRFRADRPLVAPFARRQAGAVTHGDLGSRYDYTQFRYRWYNNAILDGPGWSLITLEDGEDAAAYCVPFFAPGADPRTADARGVTCGALPLDIVSGAVEGLQLGASGYAFAFARDGQYLSHPRRELIEQRRSIFQTAWESGNTALNSMAVHAVKGERGSVEALEPLTGETDWIYYEPVPSTGWTVATAFPRKDFELAADVQRRLLFLVVLGTVVTLALGASTAVRYTSVPTPHRFWIDVGALAVLLTAGVGVLWWIADRYPAAAAQRRSQLLDRDAVEQFLLANGARDRNGARRPLIRVPTGVYIRSIAFQSSTDVMVTGYVWQRYTDGVHDGIARGFSLPEAETTQGNQITELYRTKTAGEERIGWQFAAKLRQHFSYSRYPFDRQEVWMRVRPAEFRPDIVLVPDFDGYPIMNPAALPGLTRELVLPGWQAQGSFFDYRLHAYTANFGLRTFRALEDSPELYFNVALRRLFIGPFVSSIVPLSVAVAMIFAVLVISTRRDKSSSLFGFSAESSLRSAAALFFVVSFQHVALRNSLASPVLMYFEYFYFTVYIAILLVSINAILFAAQLGVRFVEHRENLVPKLLFWPVWTACMFAITYWALY